MLLWWPKTISEILPNLGACIGCHAFQGVMLAAYFELVSGKSNATVYTRLTYHLGSDTPINIGETDSAMSYSEYAIRTN